MGRCFPGQRLGLRLHSVQQFAGNVAQFDVAPLGLVGESFERFAWITAMQRDQSAFGHVDIGTREESDLLRAGILLLLYAQPLTKIANLKYSAVVSIDGETRIMLS